MIENSEQLEQSRKALIKVENALLALKNKIHSINPNLFEAMAEDYLKVRDEITQDINVYLGINDLIDHKALVWMRMTGDNIRLLSTPTSIWTSTLNKVRKSIGSITNSLSPIPLNKLPIFDEYIKAFTDFPVVGLKDSSLKIGISFPSKI